MRFLVVVGLLVSGCGGDDGASTRTVSNNDACIPAGAGGAAGDACTTPDDCALIACCTCPTGTKMFSAAACSSTCLEAGDACDAALANNPAVCD